MFENYLIEAAAILPIINREDANRERAITSEQISAWLLQHGAERQYFEDGNDVSAFATEKWKVSVHGSRILKDLFSALTENRVAYDKVKHGLMLSRFLIDRPTEDMRGLAEMLGTIVRYAA